MTDELTTAIAAAVAAPIATAVIGGGGAAVSALQRLVKKRFSREPSAAAALTAAQEAPDDPTRLERLRTALELVTATDEEFASQLKALWRNIPATNHGTVNNTVSGEVGRNSLQARDITGGAHM